MIVCEECLRAIESREGNQWPRKLDSFADADKIVYGDYDKDGNFIEDNLGNEYVYCDCDNEYVALDEAYEI